MEDPAEQGNIGPLYWLRSRKVVFHAAYKTFKVLRKSTLKTSDCVRQVLNNAVDVRVFPRYFNANLAMGPANIDDCTVANEAEVDFRSGGSCYK